MVHGVHEMKHMRMRIADQAENAPPHLPWLTDAYMHGRMVNLAQKIVRLLDRLGLTQLQAAEKIGVNQSTVNRWTKGADIKPENLIALATLAGQTVDDFLMSESVDPTITEAEANARLAEDLKAIGAIDPVERKDLEDLVRKRAAAARERSGRAG